MPDKLRELAAHLQREGHVDNETDALLAAMHLRLALTISAAHHDSRPTGDDPREKPPAAQGPRTLA